MAGFSPVPVGLRRGGSSGNACLRQAEITFHRPEPFRLDGFAPGAGQSVSFLPVDKRDSAESRRDPGSMLIQKFARDSLLEGDGFELNRSPVSGDTPQRPLITSLAIIFPQSSASPSHRRLRPLRGKILPNSRDVRLARDAGRAWLDRSSQPTPRWRKSDSNSWSRGGRRAGKDQRIVQPS